jgi:hypothetical protein
MSRNHASSGIPAASFFAGRSFHHERQAIPLVAAGVLQPPTRAPVEATITRCPSCGVAVHASESDDEGRCQTCSGAMYPPVPRETDAISQAFAATRASVVEPEAPRDHRCTCTHHREQHFENVAACVVSACRCEQYAAVEPMTSVDWSPGQHCRRAS